MLFTEKEIEECLFDETKSLGLGESRVSFRYDRDNNYFSVQIGSKQLIIGYIFCQSKTDVLFQTVSERRNLPTQSMRIVADVTDFLLSTRGRVFDGLTKVQLAALGYANLTK